MTKPKATETVKYSIHSGDVTAPTGFKAYGAYAGLRSDRPDMALLWSAKPAVFSGMFTTNFAKAAPVTVTEKVAQDGIAQAIIINSTNANAMTGPKGMQDAMAMQSQAAHGLDIPADRVAVASTGVIGVPMPMTLISDGITQLVDQWRQGGNDEGGRDASSAILTTDTRPKTLAVTVRLTQGVVRLGMMVKGSGMIHPQMATMLGFFTTDAGVSKEVLDLMVKRVVDRSFHRVSVDGDPSTNDMVLVLANGMSEVSVDHPDDQRVFEEAFTKLAQAGARMIAEDGEGATHLLTVRVTGAESEADAALKARCAVRSPLVKSAVYGRDPNWGRVIAAVGTVGQPFNPDRVHLSMNGLTLLHDGRPVEFDEDQAKMLMGQDEVRFEVELNQGEGQAEAWGCDLTERYVEINAHYRT